MHAHIDVHTCIYKYTHTHCVGRVHTSTVSVALIHLCMYIYIFAYTCIHVYIDIHSRIYIHTHTQGAGRVHTSTVSVAVMPDGETAEFQINERDIKIEVMKGSGAGGQSVNTTESAVRMTHVPTGITVHMVRFFFFFKIEVMQGSAAGGLCCIVALQSQFFVGEFFMRYFSTELVFVDFSWYFSTSLVRIYIYFFRGISVRYLSTELVLVDF